MTTKDFLQRIVGDAHKNKDFEVLPSGLNFENKISGNF